MSPPLPASPTPTERWCPFTTPTIQDRLSPDGVCLEARCMAWAPTGGCLRLSAPFHQPIRYEPSSFEVWATERLDIDGVSIVSSRDLFEDYLAFVAARNLRPVSSQTTFGRALGDLQVILWGKDPFGRKLRKGARLRPLTDSQGSAPEAPASARDPQPAASLPPALP